MSFKENSITTFHRDDLEQIYHGITLVYWFLLFPALLVNVIAFSLPFIGGDSSHLKFIGIIYVLGGFPLVIGIYYLTKLSRMVDVRYKRIGQWLLIFTFIHVLARISNSLANFSIINQQHDNVHQLVVIFMNMSIEFSILIGLRYLRELSLVWKHLVLVERFSRYFWTYLFYVVVLWGVYSIIEHDFSVIITGISYLFGVAMAFWGYNLIFHFRRMVEYCLHSKCIQCGYLLYELPNPRCPECGTPTGIAVES